MSAKEVTLDGTLLINIRAARNLPNVEGMLASKKNTSDPYVSVKIGDNKVKTQVIDNNINPEWNQEFQIPVNCRSSIINFVVKDANTITCNTEIGCVGIEAKDLLEKNKKISGWFPIMKGDDQFGELDLSISYKTEVVFLHGWLSVEIKSAKDLPNMENWVSKLLNSKDKSDVVVNGKLEGARFCKTKVIENSLSPVWNEKFNFPVCHSVTNLSFLLADVDMGEDDLIGRVDIKAKDLVESKEKSGWMDILDDTKTKQGELDLCISFKSIEDIKESYEVETYFPMHSGCKVTLYQDAHCPDDHPLLQMVEELITDKDVEAKVKNTQCWYDMYHSIRDAKDFICITGWSVWTDLKLLRGQQAEDIYGDTLGKLLCSKADEGVKVYVMIWDELDITNGMMSTYDKETLDYFKNDENYLNPEENKVHCAVVSREKEKKSSVTDELQSKIDAAGYSHHQKTVIVDGEYVNGEDGKRTMHAYVGGLDLTSGRYDTPSHELFSTLLTDHSGDFRNTVIQSKDKPAEDVGPRQPWHDIHAKVEGGIAQDLFRNFVERWKRQGMEKANFRAPTLENIDVKAVSSSDGKKTWNVQLFRSITEDAALFDDDKFDNTNVLIKKRGKTIDLSIHKAYVQMIRNAKNFIYIENQYFMGSAFNWEHDNQTPCNHTIPAEIVAKIIKKIKAGERFTAYINIPLFPEGDPTSMGMQAMLYWQKLTIEMMYRDIGNALKEHGNSDLGDHPTDYLQFVCPAKREIHGDYLDDLAAPPSGSVAEKLRDTKRLMIYVHSKMLIVDDAYIIVGSANINQRSLSGNRDSEIAVGCWQPKYPAMNAKGEVKVFRLKLWAQHLRHLDDVFLKPQSLDCARKFKEMTDNNWKSYNYERYGLDKETPPQGQLLTYPVHVEKDGSIKNVEGDNEFVFTSFPDQPEAAKIFGEKTLIPVKITT